MNLVFFGTSEFAVPALRKLADTGHRVLAVVTQPDRPRGRGQELASSPVKQAALEKGWHLFQPENCNEYGFLRELRALSPDVIVVVAYGQKLGNEILELPRWYCLNIHPSLLPRYRGPEPVARALLRGEPATGVCIVKVVEKMDAGPVLGVARVPVTPDETTLELEDRLSVIGADLLVEVLGAVEAQTVIELPQNERDATYAPKFEKNDGRIDWRKNAARVRDFVRALQPYPVAFTFHNQQRIQVWKVAPVEGSRAPQRPGTITVAEKDVLKVACGEYTEISVLELQPENKKRMSAAEFINGYSPKVGDPLG